MSVRAEPRLGESHVEFSAEALNTVREAFGADFEHQRHCVQSAVSAVSPNVAGEMPLAGATSFRAEVVAIRVSPDAGRELSGFLLSVAAMNAIAEYLEAWENDQPVRTSGMDDRQARQAETNEPLEPSATTASEPSGPGDADPVSRIDLSSEHDLLRAAYETCYVLVRHDLEDSRTEDEIRVQYASITQGHDARRPPRRGSTRDGSGRSPDENKVPAVSGPSNSDVTRESGDQVGAISPPSRELGGPGSVIIAQWRLGRRSWHNRPRRGDTGPYRKPWLNAN